MWEAQRWTELGKQAGAVRDIVLLIVGERFPTSAALIGEFDFPGHILLCHGRNIPQREFLAQVDC